MANLYRHSDAANQRLKRYIGGRMQNFSIMPFDELNVLQIRENVKDMYVDFGRRITEEYKKIADSVYHDAYAEVRGKADTDLHDQLALLFMIAYNPVTEYVFDNELTRKRDRLVESLEAIRENHGGNMRLRKALERARNLLERQVQQGADDLTDESRLSAFRDCGVTRVMWKSIADGRRCADCADRDGQIYAIDHVPPKHPRCRCYLVPVFDGQ